MELLRIHDLHVTLNGKKILNGVHLSVAPGETVALMGPNGSGKSTLANTIMGHPSHTITQGTIQFNGKDITKEPTDERARQGIFLGFQNPKEIPGVKISQLLRTAIGTRKEKNNQDSVIEFHEKLKKKMTTLTVHKELLKRSLNQGFSGGEKKKTEILQLIMLQPTLAILDEPDSGLDIDAVKQVAKGINDYQTGKKGVLLITHYKRILEHVIPDKVLVMREGRIMQEGGKEILDQLEQSGYNQNLQNGH